MVIQIPKQLQKQEFRFVLLKTKEKIPFEQNWQNSGYCFKDKKLLEHISNGGNYGVIGGYGNLVIIDIDDKELANEISKKLNTFSVRTGSGGIHFYILSDWKENKVLKNKKGEIRAKNYQVVGPSCTHPNGNKYLEENGDRIYEYDSKVITELLGDYIDNSIVINKDENFEDLNKQIIQNKEFIIEKIIPRLNGLNIKLITEKVSKEELQKLNIASRSERDAKVITHLLLKGFGSYIKSIFDNFPIGDKYKEHTSPDKYLEHTIKSSRGYSGVNDDEVANLENDLNNIPKNVLRNKINDYLKKLLNFDDKLIQSYFISALAYKTGINKKDLLEKLDKLKTPDIEKNPISIFDLMKKDIPEQKYLMAPIIPKNTLILLGGKPSSFKSMFVLAATLNMKASNSFLNNFPVIENPKILLYDLENGENIMWWRLKYLIRGLNLDINKLQDYHIEYEFNKNNLEKEIELAKKYDVIVLDSYRRFLEGTENDSEITNNFFNNYLQILKKMGKTIIILHHFKKARLEEITDEDIMDLFRGSSDIPAQFDLIMGMFKSEEVSDTITKKRTFAVQLVKVKNRLGLPIDDFSFKVEKDDVEKQTSLTFMDFKKMGSPKERTKDRIIELVKYKGLLHTSEIINTIEKELGVSKATINRYLNELTTENILSKEKQGKYKIYNANEQLEKTQEENQLTLKMAESILKD